MTAVDSNALSVPEPALRLNLGSGEVPLSGYINLDAKRGEKIFPLDYVGSVDEIRASHVLEHFPHGGVLDVLKNWVGALKPGGILKLAVPDFYLITQHYHDGKPINIQGYVMGGQADKYDFHGTVFDEEMLREAMHAAGLRGVRRWSADARDCSALPISLNLMGIRPLTVRPKVAAVMSVPRLGFMDNMRSLLILPAMSIPVSVPTGAFWGMCLTRAIEMSIEEHAPEWVLTLDYDSVFNHGHVDALLELAARSPQADAIAAVQMKRHDGTPMFRHEDANGVPVERIERSEMNAELVPATLAHFGLTLLRVEKLQQLERPWFHSKPDAENRWGDGRVDDDIAFWQRWKKQGFSLFVAMRVPIGHVVESVMWPDINLEPIYQSPRDFWHTGAPEGVWK
jgi:SAM-dependent methyltransferase